MSGVNAGIGNLIAEGNKQRILSVFWELRAFRYWGAFILVFSFYYFIEPFIKLWLGTEYIMSRSILVVILINVFIGQTRIVVMGFLNGYGLFKDTWSSIVEAILNIGTAIILGSYMGMEGVLLGTTISLFFMIGLWKPYFLYKEGFHIPLKNYWLNTSIYFLVSISIWVLLDCLLIPYLNINYISSFTNLILTIFILVPIYAIFTWIGYCFLSQGMKDFSIRLLHIIKAKKGQL